MSNFVVEVDGVGATVAVLRLEVEVAQVGHHVGALLEQREEQRVRVLVSVRAAQGATLLGEEISYHGRSKGQGVGGSRRRRIIYFKALYPEINTCLLSIDSIQCQSILKDILFNHLMITIKIE